MPNGALSTEQTVVKQLEERIQAWRSEAWLILRELDGWRAMYLQRANELSELHAGVLETLKQMSTAAARKWGGDRVDP